MGKTKKRIFLVFVSLIGILLLINGFSYAKYISGWVWNYYLSSKGFYFTSEELSNVIVKNVNSNWDGGRTYFTISNSLNDSVISDYDITYNVNCYIEGENTNYLCYLNGTNSNEYTGTLSAYEACNNNSGNGVDVSSLNRTICETNGYNWGKHPAIKELYFDVVDINGGIVKDVTVNIEVSSITPYAKFLNGKFILHYNDSNDGELILDYRTYEDYNRIIVSNSHVDNKCLELSFDSSNFLIDADTEDIVSYKTDENGYINMIKFNIDAKDSKSYMFYNLDSSATFDSKIFNLQEAESCEQE